MHPRNPSKQSKILYFSIFILFVFQILFLLDLGFSFSVLPAEKVYYYENNPVFKGSFDVFDNTDENNIVSISINSSILKYLSLDKTSLTFKSSDTKQTVNYVLDLKELANIPGTHVFPITFTQKVLSDNQGISAQISLVSKIVVVIPYPKKFVEIEQKLQDKKLTLLISNKGEKLSDCNLFVKILDPFDKEELLERSFSINNLGIHEQKSFSIDLSENSKLSNVIEADSLFSCKDYSTNKTTLFEIPTFPYNVSVAIVDRDDSYLELMLTFKNILNSTQQNTQVFYEVVSNSKKSERKSFYLPELKPLEERSTTILIPIDFLDDTEDYFEILFSIKVKDEILSVKQKVPLLTKTTMDYKLIVFILFTLFIVLIATLRLRLKGKTE